MYFGYSEFTKQIGWKDISHCFPMAFVSSFLLNYTLCKLSVITYYSYYLI